jgi:hypothetical protein
MLQRRSSERLSSFVNLSALRGSALADRNHKFRPQSILAAAPRTPGVQWEGVASQALVIVPISGVRFEGDSWISN